MAATVTIDLDAPDPVWRQIADQIRAALVSGRLAPGERLASVRQLAVDLGVNHNTVAEAYRQLAAEGFLLLDKRAGAVVLERAAPRAAAGEQGRFARKVRLLVAEARAAGVSAAAVQSALRRASEDVS
jgi:DNA-binding transcriptional regulator YhcF (GntR family)